MKNLFVKTYIYPRMFLYLRYLLPFLLSWLLMHLEGYNTVLLFYISIQYFSHAKIKYPLKIAIQFPIIFLQP